MGVNDGQGWTTAGGWQPQHSVVPDVREVRRRRWPIVAVIVLLVAGLVAGGVVGYRQNSVAAQWRDRDQAQVARSQALTKNLASANDSIGSLNATVSDLHTQITKLQNHLSSVADAKEKALDQNVLLSRLNSEADVVSQQLSTCVDDMNSFLSEFSDDISSGYYDPSLETTASNVSNVCTAAQSDNQTLQATLGDAG